MSNGVSKAYGGNPNNSRPLLRANDYSPYQDPDADQDEYPSNPSIIRQEPRQTSAGHADTRAVGSLSNREMHPLIMPSLLIDTTHGSTCRKGIIAKFIPFIFSHNIPPLCLCGLSYRVCRYCQQLFHSIPSRICHIPPLPIPHPAIQPSESNSPSRCDNAMPRDFRADGIYDDEHCFAFCVGDKKWALDHRCSRRSTRPRY